MSQIDQFLNSLKRTLKTKNILHRDLAKALGLSESSVKRILSNKSLSLDRLEEIYRVADISFGEVVKSADLEEPNHVIYYSDPFGGIGNSGIGNYHGEEGFREMSHARTVFQRRWFPTQLFHPPYRSFVQRLSMKFFLGEGDPSLGARSRH